MQRSKTAATIATLATVALAAFAVLAIAPVASAKVTLKTVKGFPTTLDGPRTSVDVYDVDDYLSVFCGVGKGTPIAAGWSEAPTIFNSIETRFDSNPYLRISVRRPMATATVRPYAICAKGPVKATVKSKAKGTGPVSCGGKLAIGIPATSTWPYNDESAVEAKPVGKHKWVTNAPFSDSKAICVAASAFSQVKTVSRSASFRPGASSAKVTATCAGKRRPIGWGYEAPLMAGNTWDSADTSSALAVPPVAASLPSGKKGWSLTFRTPDSKGATAATQVGINLTCAVPAA